MIKAAIQLTEKDFETIYELNEATDSLKTALILYETTRETLQSAIRKRDRLIESLLLDRGYLLGVNDKIYYNPQQYKIFVYSDGTIFNEQGTTEPSD